MSETERDLPAEIEGLRHSDNPPGVELTHETYMKLLNEKIEKLAQIKYEKLEAKKQRQQAKEEYRKQKLTQKSSEKPVEKSINIEQLIHEREIKQNEQKIKNAREFFLRCKI